MKAFCSPLSALNTCTFTFNGIQDFRDRPRPKLTPIEVLLLAMFAEWMKILQSMITVANLILNPVDAIVYYTGRVKSMDTSC